MAKDPRCTDVVEIDMEGADGMTRIQFIAYVRGLLGSKKYKRHRLRLIGQYEEQRLCVEADRPETKTEKRVRLMAEKTVNTRRVKNLEKEAKKLGLRIVKGGAYPARRKKC